MKNMKQMQANPNNPAARTAFSKFKTGLKVAGYTALFLAWNGIGSNISSQSIVNDYNSMRNANKPTHQRLESGASLAVKSLMKGTSVVGCGGGGAVAPPVPADFTVTNTSYSQYGVDAIAGTETIVTVSTSHTINSASIRVTRGDGTKESINATIQESGSNYNLVFDIPEDVQRGATSLSISATDSNGRTVTSSDTTLSIAGQPDTVTVQQAPSGELTVGFDQATVSVNINNAQAISQVTVYAGGVETDLQSGPLDSNGNATYSGTFTPISGGDTTVYYTITTVDGTVSDPIALINNGQNVSFNGVSGGTTQGVTFVNSTTPGTTYPGKGNFSGLSLEIVSYQNNTLSIKLYGSGDTTQALSFEVQSGTSASPQTRPISDTLLSENGISGDGAIKVTPGTPGFSEVNVEWFTE